MNITTIYNEYDLWGKVRVSRYNSNGAPMFVKNLSIWLITIDDKVYRRIWTRYGIRGMIESAIKAYLDCEHCEGSGVVTPPLYTASGGITDCDYEDCGECKGSGKRKIKEW